MLFIYVVKWLDVKKRFAMQCVTFGCTEGHTSFHILVTQLPTGQTLLHTTTLVQTNIHLHLHSSQVSKPAYTHKHSLCGRAATLGTTSR